MAIQILLRRDVAADWTTNNPVLGTGELGYETDTNKYKVGDGATAWTTLGYHEHYSTAFNTKLSGIATGATVDQTGAAIKVAYEAEADTNAYNDAAVTKLAGIEALSEVNVPTDLAYTASTRILTSSTGANITLPEATAAVPGLSSAADKTKLDGIEASSTGDQTGAQIKVAYEAEADTNAYNDAAVSKLAAIEASATIDQTDAEIRTAVEAATDSNVFTDADHTKLNGVEALADVTDATNVDAAGAVMNTDATTASMSFVVDEDTMTSNSATKLPTQQSVKAYVDAEVAAATVSEMSYKGAYDATTNTPDLDTTPIASALGDVYTVTVAGTFFTIAVEIGDVLIAEQASPTLEGHWTIVNKNLDAASIKTSYESNADTNAYNDAAVSKLSAIEASATADQTGAEIKVAYELEADTNAYNDAAVTKLAGIATGANLATTPTDVGLSSLSASGNSLAGNFTVTGTLEVQGGIIEDHTTGTTSFDVSIASVFTTTSTSGAFTFTGAPASGKVGSVTLVSTPAGTPAYTWAASVKWAGATAPTASGSGLTDIFTFFTVDGGTIWHGVISSLNSA